MGIGCSLGKEDHRMELELVDYALEELRWGERTALNGKSLSISVTDLENRAALLCHAMTPRCWIF